jgi:hypothetical protein
MDCEEEGVGNWMIDFSLDEQVRQRIATPERGYPFSEARYADIKEWEEVNNRGWYDYIADIA